MKQKVIYIIIFLIFISISSFFYSWDYISFLKSKDISSLDSNTFIQEKNSFSLDSIETINDISFHSTPDLKFLDLLVDKINKSTNKVYVNVYIFTEKRLREALIKAKNRWVDVKVVLEKNVYNAPYLNQTTYKEFEKNNIDVKWSFSNNYVFNHGKFWIIDDEFFIGTWNFSYTTFKSNKDFFVITSDKDYKKVVEELFMNNFSGDKEFIPKNNIIQSPFSSRYKIEYLIKNAQKSLHLYMPYLYDENIFSLLSQKSENVYIEIITNTEKSDSFTILEKKWVKIKYSKKKIHAKTILVDDKYLVLSSVNFSENSIDNNMELWVIVRNNEIIKKYKDSFVNDFYK